MYKEVMDQLKKLGTEQNRKIYRRHGSKDPMFGVSFAHLGQLQKKYRGQTELAKKLWASKNSDARTLACMIVAGEELKSTELDRWAKEADSTVIAGYVGGVVAATSTATSKIKKWTASKQEFVKHVGYSTATSCLKADADKLSASLCESLLKQIEKEIHTAPNAAKSAMNWCLIAIGSYKKGMVSKAKATAKAIGPVGIDHGETSCKTPEASSYIDKALAHQKKKAAKKATKKVIKKKTAKKATKKVIKKKSAKRVSAKTKTKATTKAKNSRL